MRTAASSSSRPRRISTREELALLREAARLQLARGPAVDLRLAARGRRSATTSSGSSAPTTRMRPTSRRSSQPTIVEPWRERIESLSTATSEARRRPGRPAQLRRARSGVRLGQLPLRRLPRAAPDRAKLAARAQSWSCAEKAGLRRSRAAAPSFPLQNMRGIELEQLRRRLARVTLWMGHQARRRGARAATRHPAARRPLRDPPCRRAQDGLAARPTRSSATRRSTAPRTCGACSATTTSSG